MIILEITTEVAGHLARALAAHRAWARVNGIRLPAELGELESLATRVARERQGSTSFDAGLGGADTAPVQPDLLLLDRPTAARRLGLSERTVDRLVAAGDLAAVRVGRLVKFRPDELDAFAGGSARPPGGPPGLTGAGGGGVVPRQGRRRTGEGTASVSAHRETTNSRPRSTS